MGLKQTAKTQFLSAMAMVLLCGPAKAFQSDPAPVFPTVNVKVAGEKQNPPQPAPTDAQEDKAAAAAKAAPIGQSAPADAKPAVSSTDPKKATPDSDQPWRTLGADPAASSNVPDKPKAAANDGPETGMETYVLGPQDTLRVRVVDMEEMGSEPYPIDLRGNLMLPRIGRVHAAGKTAEQMEAELITRYREYLQDPVVSVSVVEFHSQPISILGAVENPGVHQIKGSKSLFEVISEAGGLRDDAGNTITITRKLENGKLPLANATNDASGKYSVADLNIRSVMSARNPSQNIGVKPYDVITVPKADLIYVIGSVKRPGGFPLQERANMTVLEALALAQGLERTASGGKAKILRTDENTHSRTEIPVDVTKIMQGKLTDTALLANDILFIPTSAGKAASYRALEALVTTGTGIAIYRP